MSERTPRGGRGRGRRGEEPDWLEHSGSSVFGASGDRGAPDATPDGVGDARRRGASGGPASDPRTDRPADPWQERRQRIAPWATPAGGQRPTPTPPARPDPYGGTRDDLYDNPPAPHRGAPDDPYRNPPDPYGSRPGDSRPPPRPDPYDTLPGPRGDGRPDPYDGPATQRYAPVRPDPYDALPGPDDAGRADPYAPRRDPYGSPAGGRGRPDADRRGRPPSGGPPDRRSDGSGRDRSQGGGLRSPIGLGAVVGGLGALAFLAALLVLPWFTQDGADVTLSDMRSAFSVPETDPEELPGAGDPTASSLPEGIPSPDDVAGAVEQQARDTATTVAAGAIDDGKARYLELYADTLWLVLAIAVPVAALVSTVLAPKSMALSLLLGFRRLAGAVVILAGLVHGAALWIVFTGTGAPSPLWGVWLGLAGLAGVLAGCVIGPRR